MLPASQYVMQRALNAEGVWLAWEVWHMEPCMEHGHHMTPYKCRHSTFCSVHEHGCNTLSLINPVASRVQGTRPSTFPSTALLAASSPTIVMKHNPLMVVKQLLLYCPYYAHAMVGCPCMQPFTALRW
jgi:hypothetical protein